MACDVEREAFLDGSLCFNSRRDEGFFSVDRIDQVAPIRTDDCTASIQQHIGLPFQFITQFILPGKHAFLEVHRRYQDETPAFKRIMTACKLMQILSMWP